MVRDSAFRMGVIMKNKRHKERKKNAKIKKSIKCTTLDFSSFFWNSLNNFCEKMLAWLVWQPWVWPEGAAELYQPMGTASDKKGNQWQELTVSARLWQRTFIKELLWAAEQRLAWYNLTDMPNIHNTPPPRLCISLYLSDCQLTQSAPCNLTLTFWCFAILFSVPGGISYPIILSSQCTMPLQFIIPVSITHTRA